MQTAVAVIISIVAGIASSATFFLLLRRLRPEIAISPQIALGANNGAPTYALKFVNTSGRDIVDVEVTLWLARWQNVPGGRFLNREQKLLVARVPHIPRYRRGDSDAKYAYRVWGSENLPAVWNQDDDQFLIMTVSARDEFSGFHGSVRREFTSRTDALHVGKHRFGEQLDVVSAPSKFWLPGNIFHAPAEAVQAEGERG